jgi:hypothetical protein
MWALLTIRIDDVVLRMRKPPKNPPRGVNQTVSIVCRCPILDFVVGVETQIMLLDESYRIDFFMFCLDFVLVIVCFLAKRQACLEIKKSCMQGRSSDVGGRKFGGLGWARCMMQARRHGLDR